MKKIKLMLLCFIITASMLISCINPAVGSDNNTKKKDKKNSGKKITGYKYDIKTEKGLIATINDKEEYDRIMNESGQNSAGTKIFNKSAAAGSLLGDVNSDGIVNINDALLVARYSSGITVPDFNTDAADVNHDGVININDALLVARFAAGLITEFPSIYTCGYYYDGDKEFPCYWIGTKRIDLPGNGHLKSILVK